MLHYEEARPEDAELLTRTAIDSKRNWGYSDQWMQLWQTDLEITPAYILENRVVKLTDADRFIGFFAMKLHQDTPPEIDHLWLTNENQQRGYGRQIFSYIRQYLSSNGFATVTLVAEPHAKGFYDKMGGHVVGKFESKISGRFLEIYEFEIG